MKIFNTGLVNAHRSAILAYHNFTKWKPIDKHPKIIILLAGSFNERLPQPWNIFIWDVDVVLTYIKNDMSVTF